MQTAVILHGKIPDQHIRQVGLSSWLTLSTATGSFYPWETYAWIGRLFGFYESSICQTNEIFHVYKEGFALNDPFHLVTISFNLCLFLFQ